MRKVLVVRLDDRWAVQREHEAVCFARFPALDEAVEYGRMLAEACGSEVVVAAGGAPRSSDATGGVLARGRAVVGRVLGRRGRERTPRRVEQHP